jgi:hypothetical protein
MLNLPEFSDKGLFGPESVMWKLNREQAILLGGPYSAFDPDLQLWALATLIQGAVSNDELFISVFRFKTTQVPHVDAHWVKSSSCLAIPLDQTALAHFFGLIKVSGPSPPKSFHLV